MISIHGPRVGADSNGHALSVLFVLFQSTAPVWGPTDWLKIKVVIVQISIHGPRVGADRKC